MLRPLVLLAIIVALSVGAVAQPTTAQEPIDISGEWTVEGYPLTETSCPWIFAQVGTELSAAEECHRLNFSGKIDPSTGKFTLTAALQNTLRMNFEGTASSNAFSMVSVDNSFLDPVAAEGTKKGEPALRPNVSGDWMSTLTGFEEPRRCPMTVWHREGEIEISLDCGSGTGGSFAGTFSVETGRFLLSGNLFGADGELEGIASQSGRVLTAVWSIPSLGSGSLNGHLEVRTGGVVAIDCDGTTEGIQEACSYDTGDRFLVQVHIVEAPPDGYNGFELNVQWTPPQLAYREAGELENEFLESECDLADRGNQWVREVRPHPATAYVCLNEPGSDVRLLPGIPVEIVVSCWSEGDGALSIGGGASTILWTGGIGSGSLDLVRPVISGASVTCRPKVGQLGDIDCSGSVDSIDSALLLQFSARLLGHLSCDYKGDMSQDGRLTSIDALIILQKTAGLL